MKSKIDKLFKAGFEIGKYARGVTILSGVLASLGCLHLPKPISVSGDGRYIAMRVKGDGEVIMNKEENSRFIILDGLTNNVQDFPDTFDMSFWLSNSASKIAFASDVDKDEDTDIVILNNGKLENIISDAAYPCLSLNGGWLAYSKRIGDGKDITSKIMIKNLKTKEEFNLGIEGLVTGFSPDNKYLSYLTSNESIALASLAGTNIDSFDGDEFKRHKYFLGTYCFVDKKNKIIASIQPSKGIGFPSLYPKWVNNDQLVFQTTTKNSEDGEIFLVNKNGGIEPITSNNLEESIPQIGKDGKLYFLVPKEVYAEKENLNSKQNKVTKDFLYVSEKTNLGWKERNLGINAEFFTVAGDNIYYMTELGDSRNLYSVSLKSLDNRNPQPINLNEKLKRK